MDVQPHLGRPRGNLRENQRPHPRHLQQLRRQGHRGGEILTHRAIRSLNLPWQRLIGGALLALAFTGLLAAVQPWVATLWGAEMVGWMKALALPGQFAMAVPGDGNLFILPVPLIDLPAHNLARAGVAAHGLAVVAVWVLAGWLPDAAKPGAFVLRFAALLHGSAVLYFLFWPASFPHALSAHVSGGLRQSWALMLITPWLHLCTYYLFPFPAWQRVALTAVTLLFITVLAPLQYASHVALLHLAGPILMPLLYLLFGLMVPVLGLVALYGWAMSWCAPTPERQRA